MFFPLQAIPCFFGHLPFFSKNLSGSVRVKNPCFLGCVFPCFLPPKKQGKEGQGYESSQVNHPHAETDNGIAGSLAGLLRFATGWNLHMWCILNMPSVSLQSKADLSAPRQRNLERP